MRMLAVSGAFPVKLHVGTHVYTVASISILVSLSTKQAILEEM